MTPERELAYLALVSSRAEEDLDLTNNSNGKGNGDASGDVEMNSASQLDSAHSAAVALPGNEAVKENPLNSDKTMVEEPSSIEQSTSQLTGDSDVEMAPPPTEKEVPQDEANKTKAAIEDSLPDQFFSPAPGGPVSTTSLPAITLQDTASTQNSLMQLGAQQDVSECLDNVMFQLEVALGAQNDESGKEEDEDENREGQDLLRG